MKHKSFYVLHYLVLYQNGLFTKYIYLEQIDYNLVSIVYNSNCQKAVKERTVLRNIYIKYMLKGKN